MSNEFKVHWKNCFHPFENQKKLEAFPVDNNEPLGELWCEIDCLLCGSTKTQYVNHKGEILQDFSWTPPEFDRDY